MKIVTILILFSLTVSLYSCSEEETLQPSDQALFPDYNNTELDNALRKMFGSYNTVVEYRYIENLLPTDWYSITPVEERFVLPAMTFMKQMWIDVLVEASSEEFVQSYFPRMLVLVGSPALRLDGTEILGEAEGGTLVRFTRINDFDPTSLSWAEKQLNTAFHEYAHIMHQTFNMPDDFRNVTPNSYTLNGWMALDMSEALCRGMVSPYGTSSVNEDFAELFATYILLSDDLWNYMYQDQPIPNPKPGIDEDEMQEAVQMMELVRRMNAGRALVRTKFEILNKFLDNNGLDIVKARIALQNKLQKLN